jgi:hypothetical protein
MAERGGFEPPRPLRIRWAKFLASLAHYFGPIKASVLQRIVSRGLALIRISGSLVGNAADSWNWVIESLDPERAGRIQFRLFPSPTHGSLGAGVLAGQFVEECFGILQVGGVEAFSEPVVDVGEHRARFGALILHREQPRETDRRAQFV